MAEILPELRTSVTAFEANRESVYELMGFDRAVLDLALRQLRSLDTRIKKAWAKAFGKDEVKLSPQQSVKKTIQLLANIRKHESLKPRYEQMINQCLVLLVSYVGSAVRDLFRTAVSYAVQEGRRSELLQVEVSTTVDELRDLETPMHEFVADYMTSRSDLSFQDMKSIGRALNKYFGYNQGRDQVIHDIVAGQACRHAIVHSGLEADRRLIRQLRSIKPRSIKPEIELGDQLQFSEEEVRRVGNAMTVYLDRAATGLQNTLAAS